MWQKAISAVSGGGDITLDLNDMQQSVNYQVVPATIGKKYLCTYSHAGGGGAIASGGTVDSYYQYIIAEGTIRVYTAVVTATSNQITFTGSGNYIHYMPLD